MPAKSESQRRLFAIAEHHPDQLYGKNKGLAKLPRQTLHDFASTKNLADGRKPMTNSVFQQSEPVRGGKRPAWMEAGGSASAKKQPMLAEGDMPKTNGRPPGAYRVRAKSAMMADGKKPEKWAAGAFAHNKGGLHRATGTPEGEKIPADKMQKALHSSNLHTKRMALAAHNI